MSSSEASLDEKNNGQNPSDSGKYGVGETSSNTLCIENLDVSFDGGSIKRIFSSYGHNSVIKDHDTAYVTFEKEEEAICAHDDDHLFDYGLGKNAKVTYAPYEHQPNIVYLKNLPENIEVKDLQLYFSSYGKIGHIELKANCCSIGYADSCAAVTAFRAHYGKFFIHTDVEISMQYSKDVTSPTPQSSTTSSGETDL